ncbi:LIC12628 family protein [Leptospira ellisii]|uniref:Uncharacterized protein n=1 Tax=Leptospira ellisii TaxID=2023197 RepID=A0A2N0BMD5_9LEPT|nr:hypothetical protein CH379_16295 [Leptospira ellisii]PKA05166.1 hypothetical protein CH375_06715 [Leptospira ellisii]
MIISWEKIRHPHPKEEWKELLRKVDISEEIGGGSSHVFSGSRMFARKDLGSDGISSYKIRYY